MEFFSHMVKLLSSKHLGEGAKFEKPKLPKSTDSLGTYMGFKKFLNKLS